MGTLTHIRTLTAFASGFGADIHWLRFIGTRLWALAGYDDTARLIEMDGASQQPLSTTLLGTGEVDLGGRMLDSAVTALPGAPTGMAHYDDNSGQMADRVLLADGAGSVWLAAMAGQPGLASYDTNAPGVALDQDGTVGPLGGLASLTAYGRDWVIGSETAADRLVIWEVGQAGGLTRVSDMGAAQGLGINAPTAMTPFSLTGQPYVAVVAGDSSTLSILRVETDGSMTPTDHILDDLGTRFQGAGLVAAHQVGGVTFLAVSGRDDGVSLFQVLGDGTLVHLDTVADQGAWVLENPAGLALSDDGVTLSLAVSSATEAGLSVFGWDIANLGSEIWGTGGSDVITGGAGDDVVLAGSGDDSVTGGNGADILADGAGLDQLTGGNGSDLFLLSFDGDFDRIEDFERMRDRLDLSRYPLAHDASAVTLVSKSWGAQLTIRGDVVAIYSADGGSLDLADLGVLFPIDRPPLVLALGGSGANGPQGIQGNDADNILYGAATDDILTGNGGDDTLVGGPGADQLLGGAGFDTASYRNALAGVVVDIASLGANAGDAAGDSYGGIEAVEGSGFADTITGGSAAMRMDGRAGNDRISGGLAADSLLGGAGDDWLTGGGGADMVNGGAGFDRAVFGTAVRVDLTYGARATGAASGDRFTDIEGVVGSGALDWLYGDDSSNAIEGNGGDDWLVGRKGNDTLKGGAGNDVLSGGRGHDRLDGGAGRDRADYSDQVKAVSVDLGAGIGSDGAKGDSFVSIEDLGGSLGDDTLTGDRGDNRLFGHGGDDRMTGAGGNDTLLGGAGADQFVFRAGFGRDQIADFDPSEDRLIFAQSMTGSTNVTGVIGAFGVAGSSSVSFDFGTDGVVVLEGISAVSDLTDVIEFI